MSKGKEIPSKEQDGSTPKPEVKKPRTRVLAIGSTALILTLLEMEKNREYK